MNDPVTGNRLLADLYNNLPKYFDHEVLLRMLRTQRTTLNEKLDADLRRNLGLLCDLAEHYTVRNPWYSLLSVKLVLPRYCQANCEFCYNRHKDYGNQTLPYDIIDVDAMMNTLYQIERLAQGRPISIEITGGEPTFHPSVLKTLLNGLAKCGFNKRAKRITLTTNGYQASRCLVDMCGVVKYMNISLHSTDYRERTEIFGTASVPNNDDLVNIVNMAYANGIDTSSVFVVDDFDMTVNEFDRINQWSSDIGFVSTRWRSNVFKKSSASVKSFLEKLSDDSRYEIDVYEESKDSAYSIVTRNHSNLAYLLEGVEDSTETSLGVSVLIRSDGKAFHDASCKIPVQYFGEPGFVPLRYVFDKK